MAKKKDLDAALQYVKNKLPQMGFFSTLDELIANAPFEKAPLEQWKNYLQAGRVFEREGVRFPLKQEEIDYTLDDPNFLAVAHVEGEDLTRSLDKEKLRQMVQRTRPDLALRVGLEGNRASHERRFDFPEDRFPEEFKTERGTPQTQGARYSDVAHDHSTGDYEESATRSTDFGPGEMDHFGPDVISHSRTTIQKTPKGQLVRLVEEIQSDRHQRAAAKVLKPGAISGHRDEDFIRRGYRNPKREDEITRRISEISNETRREMESSGVYPVNQARTKELTDLGAELNRLMAGIADAPFKRPEDYGLLELKNQMLNAAKQDQDYLGLVSGADVSRRFSHGADQKAGTSHIYDKVYPAQLEKLARQYGTAVEEVEVPIVSSVDIASPTMREWGSENISDVMDHVRGHAEEGGDVGDERDAREYFGTHVLENLIEEMNDADPSQALRALKSLHQVELAYTKPSDFEDNADFRSWWNQLAEDLEILHQEYADAVRRNSEKGAKGKTFPAMKLTPEIREKIRRVGVPIWALAGTAAGLEAQRAIEEDEGYAEGGKVDRELEDLKKRVGTGFKSQWYGVDEDGNVRLFGGIGVDDLVFGDLADSFKKNVLGKHTPKEYGPGILDELRSLLALGTEKGDRADDRLTKLKEEMNRRAGLGEARGFDENAAEALGTMLGQLPIPGSATKQGIKSAGSRMKRILKAAPNAIVEWFTPTVQPSPMNYLSGATVGGGIGALANPDEEQTLEDLILDEHGVVRKAEGGKVEDTKAIRDMMALLRMRMGQLGGTPAGSISGSDKPEQPVMKAKGGKVDTLLKLREKIMSRLESPNVEGTGREIQALKEEIAKSSGTEIATVTPERSTPESLVEMINKPLPAVPSAPFQASRRQVLQSIAGMLSPVDVPLSATGVAKTLAKQVMPDPKNPFVPQSAVFPEMGDREVLELLDEARDYLGEASVDKEKLFLAIRQVLGEESKPLEREINDYLKLREEGSIKDLDLDDAGELTDRMEKLYDMQLDKFVNTAEPNEFFRYAKEASWDRPSAWRVWQDAKGLASPEFEVDGNIYDELSMRELEPEEIEYLEKIFPDGIPEELLNNDWDT